MQGISWEMWTSITLSPQFLILSGIFFALPFIIYLIVGALVKGKSSSGKTQTKSMIFYENFWIAILIFDIGGLIAYIPMIIFPLWIRIFN